MDISDFLKAFADEFKNLTLRAKLIVIVIGLVIWLVSSALFYPDAARDRIEYCTNWIRAATSTDSMLPLSESTRNKFVELQRSIETGLVNQVDTHLAKSVSKEEALKDSKYNSWTTSQIAIALPFEANKHVDTFLQRFEHWKHNSGNGRNEFPNDSTIKIPILAWTLSAQVSVFGKLDEQDISFLLAQQNVDGWWGTYAGTVDSKYAATYATAIAILTLSDVVSEKKVTTTQLPKILIALRTASDWLRVKKSGPFWADYPNHNGTLRPAITGIVLHALHAVSRSLGDDTSSQLTDFDRDFLDNLRVEHLPPEFSEVSGLNVHDFQIDHVRIYFYPSQILGVASAYHSVDLKHKAEALAWLTSVADDVLKARNIAAESPWIAAEYLIAINLLLSK